jgi:hypothetical protein
MEKRSNGGVVGTVNTPTSSIASGIWSLTSAQNAEGGDNWPALTPGAPTSVSASPGNAEATVTFTAPVADGGSPITGYRVTSTPGSITATGSSSPITITGLTNGTSYTFTVAAQNANGYGPESDPSNSVTPALVWNEAGSGATQTALINNLLFVGLGNTVYEYANVASLVQADTNPKSTSGLTVPNNYSVGNNYSSGSTHGMTSSAPTKFSSSDGYGTNSFRTAGASAPELTYSWSGSPNPGIACCWYYFGGSGQHFIGNSDCTSRYLLDNHPTVSSWYWIVVDLFNDTLYWNGSSQGSAGGTYSNLYCNFYMGWSNSNTVDAYYHDYRVYEYDSSNHSAMVTALLSTPSTSYYTGGT